MLIEHRDEQTVARLPQTFTSHPLINEIGVRRISRGGYAPHMRAIRRCGLMQRQAFRLPLLLRFPVLPGNLAPLSRRKTFGLSRSASARKYPCGNCRKHRLADRQLVISIQSEIMRLPKSPPIRPLAVIQTRSLDA